ncbi:SGNH/GDSL hydrolase family protein [Marinilabilia salmonicolor]|uniref:SGNH/GDSL hydrolase family protein n=1 Tax=Marinilabilia salmonicolor TaxID=989 RepID=UPI000299D8AD|nr:SGNH/GDSL hydrolase family protein [Marinilabilia salmonicolor]
MKSGLLITVFFFLMSVSIISQNKENFFSASHEYFNYMGRVDFSDKQIARYDWPGVTVRFQFTGNELKLHFKGGERNYFDLFVDGEPFEILHAKEDTIAVIKGIIGNGPHEARFFKRTEGEMGETHFYGIELSHKGRLLPWEKEVDRCIEFVGNSITCGYGAESESREDDFDPRTENVGKSYATIIAEALKADYHVIAHSGLGVVRNYGDSQKVSTLLATMPQRFGRSLDMDDSIEWDFSNWQANAVIINLGTNDFSTEPHPDRVVFQRAYEKLIKQVRLAYGAVPVFCVVGPLTNEPCHTYVKEVVQNNGLLNADENVYFIGIPPTLLDADTDFGADAHPSYSGQQKMADHIIPVISTVMGWQ